MANGNVNCSTLCKRFSFKGTKEVAELRGVTPATIRNEFNKQSYEWFEAMLLNLMKLKKDSQK